MTAGRLGGLHADEIIEQRLPPPNRLKMKRPGIALSTMPAIPSHRKWRWIEFTRAGRAFVAWRLYVRNPVPLPGFIPRDAPERVQHLLRVIYAAELRMLGNPGRLTRAVMVTGWAFTTAVTCVINFRRNLPILRRELPASSPLRHLRKLLVCAYRHNISPSEFYSLKLYLDRCYRQRHYYAPRWQVTTLINEALPDDEARRLNDKYHLWRLLTAAGIPTVPVLSLVDGRRWTGQDWAGLAAAGHDLVVKPARLSSGDGIEFFDTAGPQRWLHDGCTLSDAEVRQRIEALSDEHPFVIQARLENHPMLARYGSKGLATLRIVTAKTRARTAPECLMAVARIPGSKSRLANFHKRALACSIDLATGRLGPGASWSPAGENHRTHPETGVPLAGEVLPYWEESKAACLRAHALAPTLNTVGWDVVLTPEGPFVLEANLRWGARVLQIALRQPLYLSSFTDYYEQPGKPS